MKRIFTLFLCLLLLTGGFNLYGRTHQPSQRPPISGIIGFHLGMTRAQALAVIQQKGWRLEREGNDIIRMSFSRPRYFSGLYFSSISLTFAPSGLARIFLGSPKEDYDENKTLNNYYNSLFLNNLEEKYGLPDNIWYGHNGRFESNALGYRSLRLRPVSGEEFEYTSALELTWHNEGRRIWVGYFKRSPNVYSQRVFVGVFYEDDVLWKQYHDVQASDY